MADCPIEPDHLNSCRSLLETALQCLEQAGLHEAAAYIDMALELCRERERKALNSSAPETTSLNHSSCAQNQKDQIPFAGPINTESIERLYRNIINHNTYDEKTILRTVHFIATNHRPASATVASRSDGSADQFHKFLAAGASSSAALTLMEPGFSYMVSRGAGRRYLASVVIPGTDRDVCAEGTSFAAALAAAYLGALVAT